MSVTRKLLAKSNEGREELHLDRTKEDLSGKKKKKILAELFFKRIYNFI